MKPYKGTEETQGGLAESKNQGRFLNSPELRLYFQTYTQFHWQRVEDNTGPRHLETISNKTIGWMLSYPDPYDTKEAKLTNKKSRNINRLHIEETEFTESIQASHHSNLRDRMGRNQNLKLTFWGTANCFPKWLHQLFYRVTTLQRESLCGAKKTQCSPLPCKK